jgi:hypothetical protein
MAATTKIEAENYFSQWSTFCGDGIFKSRDPLESEKQVKHKDLIANAIMLQNVVDMTMRYMIWLVKDIWSHRR